MAGQAHQHQVALRRLVLLEKRAQTVPNVLLRRHPRRVILAQPRGEEDRFETLGIQDVGQLLEVVFGKLEIMQLAVAVFLHAHQEGELAPVVGSRATAVSETRAIAAAARAPRERTAEDLPRRFITDLAALRISWLLFESILAFTLRPVRLCSPELRASGKSLSRDAARQLTAIANKPMVTMTTKGRFAAPRSNWACPSRWSPSSATETKKPTWLNTLRCSTTSAYSSTGSPARPGCPSYNGIFEKTHGYCTDVFFRQALRWIDRERSGGRPFFAYITPNAAHEPLQVPDDYFHRYRGKVPDNVARFFGMIENIDDNFGGAPQEARRMGPRQQHACRLHDRQRWHSGNGPLQCRDAA